MSTPSPFSNVHLPEADDFQESTNPHTETIYYGGDGDSSSEMNDDGQYG